MQIVFDLRLLNCSSGETEVCESLFGSRPLCLMLFRLTCSATAKQQVTAIKSTRENDFAVEKYCSELESESNVKKKKKRRKNK